MLIAFGNEHLKKERYLRWKWHSDSGSEQGGISQLYWGSWRRVEEEDTEEEEDEEDDEEGNDEEEWAEEQMIGGGENEDKEEM